MDPDTAKTLAGVGWILAVVGISGASLMPPAAGAIIIGYILVLVGMRGLGDYYNDEGMKRDSLWWFIWGFIGGIAAVVASFIATFSWLFGALAFGTLAGTSAAAFFGALIGIIAMLIIIEVFNVLSARHLKRVYATLAAKSGEGLFNTAAKLYWWGSLLIIVLVGALLIWISWILSAVAFLSMKPGAAARAAPPPPA